MEKLEILYDFNDRYNALLKKDNTHERDLERKALFYIIAGNLDLYKKVNYIYDFDEHSIIPENLENKEIDFCSSSKQLIKLAYNLYNGYPCNIVDVFSVLDEENYKVAINSIAIRFNKPYATII